MSLQVTGKTIHLEIADNGQGLKPATGAQPPSLGVVGMRARARQVGGELTIENRKEGGLAIRARVPLRQVSENADQENTNFVG